jgi:hypothetical protein
VSLLADIYKVGQEALSRILSELAVGAFVFGRIGIADSTDSISHCEWPACLEKAEKFL